MGIFKKKTVKPIPEECQGNGDKNNVKHLHRRENYRIL